MRRIATHLLSLIQAFVGIVLLVLTAGCQYDPYAHLYLTDRTPPRESVAGTYLLRWDWLGGPGTQSAAGTNASLELKPDGSFAALRFPVVTASTGWDFARSGETNLTGRWEFAETGVLSPGQHAISGIRLWRTDDGQFQWGESGVDSIFATLLRQSYPHGLAFGFGDPDFGHVLIFERPERFHATSPDAVEDDAVPFASALGLVGALGFVALIALAFLAALAGLAALGLLVTLGVVSSSVLFAVWKRNATSGFRVLFIQIGIGLGALSGLAAGGLHRTFSAPPHLDILWLAIPTLAGAAFGVLVALLFNFAWTRLLNWLGASVFKSTSPDSTHPPS